MISKKDKNEDRLARHARVRKKLTERRSAPGSTSTGVSITFTFR